MRTANTDFPLHLFHHGENVKTYELMGAHPVVQDRKRGYVFRVWAPRAAKVSVVGDFNNWKTTTHVMQRMIDKETFELFIPNLKKFDEYKYCIQTQDGRQLYKADPYAFHTETPNATSKNASKLFPLNSFKWTDRTYLENRREVDARTTPMNVYEVNLLSWKLHEDGSYYSYLELAEELVNYVSKMGYTHVEFMPIMEFPYDGSWGYQTTGYFAPTSRLGNPYDFMKLIDAFHNANIGVILDWVPSHFPKDVFGLYEFDGFPLYESSQWDRMEQKGGTRGFDFARNEIISFLLSGATFWFDKYHIDGLRIGSLTSLLYLDYDKKQGQWVPNIYGENKNLEGIAFLRRLNDIISNLFPGALMIAEDSTAWPMMTKPVKLGGLGFHFKWNTGWKKDTLEYQSLDPIYRKDNHSKLTYSMMYAFSEEYILPLSHDEVVHGKGSFIEKMPGSYEEKFAGLRALMGYMISHPGKKLQFMGSEIGQFKEWNYNEGIEFFLKEYPIHEKYSKMVQTLNILYKKNSALHAIENSWKGFAWLAPDDAASNFLAYQRMDQEGNTIIVMINFSGADLVNYRLGVPEGKYQVLFNSDSVRYGGKGKIKKTIYHTEKTYSHGRGSSIVFDLPKMTCVYLEKIKS